MKKVKIYSVHFQKMPTYFLVNFGEFALKWDRKPKLRQVYVYRWTEQNQQENIERVWEITVKNWPSCD